MKIAVPQLILLDEPTTGVDPVSRRFMWNCIQDCQKNNKNIVLTSHRFVSPFSTQIHSIQNHRIIIINHSSNSLFSITFSAWTNVSTYAIASRLWLMAPFDALVQFKILKIHLVWALSFTLCTMNVLQWKMAKILSESKNP